MKMKQLVDSLSTHGDITWCTQGQPISSGGVTSYAKTANRHMLCPNPHHYSRLNTKHL